MNILLVNPRFPDTFWSFKHAIKFVFKKGFVMPLGLLTVASLLPTNWEKKLIDLNIEDLEDKDIIWADFVFIGAMSIQTKSVNQIIERCLLLNIKVVGGGPYFTEEFEQFSQVDHLVLNEAEITLPMFIEDIEKGHNQKIYQSESLADMTHSPIPDYKLLKIKNYWSASIQYSRGCPFDCEFCDITALFGRKVRIKTSDQIIKELDVLFQIGWRGIVFIVDDNFIANIKKLKIELLPKIIKWNEAHRNPFMYTTQASINLSDDPELMQLMVRARFQRVFIGIETPNETSLLECNKIQNKNRNLIECVKTIQQSGLEVSAGLIIGFDNDPQDIFQRQVDFVQKSGIVLAMLGLLNAPRLSKLYKRLKNEGRIIQNEWDNMSYTMNIVPVMDRQILMQGYKKTIYDLYSYKPYYERVMFYLKHNDPPFKEQSKITIYNLLSLVKSFYVLGILQRGRRYFWKLMFWSLISKPKTFRLAVIYSVYGYHFRKVFNISD